MAVYPATTTCISVPRTIKSRSGTFRTGNSASTNRLGTIAWPHPETTPVLKNSSTGQTSNCLCSQSLSGVPGRSGERHGWLYWDSIRLTCIRTPGPPFASSKYPERPTDLVRQPSPNHGRVTGLPLGLAFMERSGSTLPSSE